MTVILKGLFCVVIFRFDIDIEPVTEIMRLFQQQRQLRRRERW